MTQAVHALRIALVVAVCAAFGSVGSVARADVTAQGCTAQAVVVVEPGPGAVSICFDGSISGLEALQLAGANPVTYGFSGQGAAVCQLYGVGNPADASCLVGPGGQYWAYYRAGPGAGGWTYSRAGASSTTVVDGSVEGWRYGTGGAPGFVPFCSVARCAPPATDPPAPVIPAPAPAPAGTPPAAGPGVTNAPSGPTRSGASGTPGSGDQPTGTGADAPASGSTSPTSTTNGGDRAGSTRSRRPTSVQVAAGPGRGGGDSGSPMGVVVAGIVLVVGAGAAAWLRRRRQGPAPG